MVIRRLETRAGSSINKWEINFMSGWFVSNANPNKLSQETLGPAISKIIGTLPVGTPFA